MLVTVHVAKLMGHLILENNYLKKKKKSNKNLYLRIKASHPSLLIIEGVGLVKMHAVNQ